MARSSARSACQAARTMRWRKPAPTRSSKKSADDFPPDGSPAESSGEPFEYSEAEIAEYQKHPGPEEGGGDIGELEIPIRHFQNARDQRHRGPQRAEEAAD